MNLTKRVVLIIAACVLSAGALFAQVKSTTKIVKTTDGSKTVPEYITNLAINLDDSAFRAAYGIKRSERLLYAQSRAEDQKQAELQAKANLYVQFLSITLQVMTRANRGNNLRVSSFDGLRYVTETNFKSDDYLYIMYSDSGLIPSTQIEEAAVQVLIGWRDCDYSQVILNYGTEDAMTAIAFNTPKELEKFNWNSIADVETFQFIGIPSPENDLLTLQTSYGIQLERSVNGKKSRNWAYFYICSYNEAEYGAYLNSLMESMPQSSDIPSLEQLLMDR